MYVQHYIVQHDIHIYTRRLEKQRQAHSYKISWGNLKTQEWPGDKARVMNLRGKPSLSLSLCVYAVAAYTGHEARE